MKISSGHLGTSLPLLFLLLKSCFGSLQCRCNTPECQTQGLLYCRARSFCYTEVQIFQPQQTRITTFGCIDEATPLMCDQNLQGGRRFLLAGGSPQLQLTCCRTNRCNMLEPEAPLMQLITNAPPPPVRILKDRRLNLLTRPTTIPVATQQPPKIHINDHQFPPSVQYEDFDTRFREGRNNNNDILISDEGFNPIFVAIPALAACLFLCFVIVIIFLTKQRCIRQQEQQMRSKPGHYSIAAAGSDADSASSEYREKCLMNSVICSRAPIHTVFYSPYTKLSRNNSPPGYIVKSPC